MFENLIAMTKDFSRAGKRSGKSRSAARHRQLRIEGLENRICASVDLAPYYVNAPVSAPPGGTAAVSIGISNYGNTPSGGFYVGIYASTSSYVTTSSILLKSDWRPSLSGWSSQSWSESVSLPSWLNGNYRLGVIADPWGYVADVNRGNNALAAWNTTTISAPAPTISGINPTSPMATGYATQVTILGNNFLPGCSVTLCDLTAGRYYLAQSIISQSQTQIVIAPNLGTSADLWTVQVANPGNSSTAQYFFNAQPACQAYNPYYTAFLSATFAAGVPSSWASDSALLSLVQHESSWNPYAQNPTSTAYGLFQLLDPTWRDPNVNVAKSSDPYWQAVAGFKYIKAYYQTPERAWAFWQATVYRNKYLAPSDLQWKAGDWISKGWGGY